jgi:hypothetical protein
LSTLKELAHVEGSVDPRDRHLTDRASQQRQLQANFCVGGEPGLADDQLFGQLTTHQLQVVCHVTQAAEPDHQIGKHMERAVGNDLAERVIDQHAPTRKPAAEDNIDAFRAASNMSSISGGRC